MNTHILITILAVTGINAVLAILLVIAERFLANYGQVKLTINDEKIIEVKAGATLLSTLNSQKIFLPSACGGRGTCAYCKCKITEGVGPLLPTETPLLSKEEIAEKFRIACQVKVKQDIKIDIPDELFSIQEFKAEVILIQDLTYDIKLVRLKLIHPDQIKFKAGQYIQLQTQPYNGVKGSVSRAYSIASPVSENHHLDLIIRLVPEGICTTWVHQYLKSGDFVSFIGPMGDFQLHGSNEEMILVAGGSGMAPMIPLLHDLAVQKSERKITYFFGANQFRDLFYIDEMRNLEKRISNYRFIPVLSTPAEEDHWKGKTGLVTVPLEAHLQSIDARKTQGYLCGSPGMINACVKLMEEYGITRNQIFFDPFS